MMPHTKEPVRDIIEDFAREIQQRKVSNVAKPSLTVINFRTDRHDGKERVIERVPLECLRYRKDNGRIVSDVLDYEKNVGPLNERDAETQKVIGEFLREKDPERSAVLTKSMLHSGQLEPAIITADGFLINGNRRKMVLEQLSSENPEHTEFGFMKVVILPSKDDIGEGGPPTLVEIEKLENRYQLQSDGRSEYYGFDRALSIRRKIDLGFSLEEQLRDDPRYTGLARADLEKVCKQYERDFLEPLACVDRYLRKFNREGFYRTISSGMGDPEGRWQAFLDYSNTCNRYLRNPRKLLELGIEEDEVGTIEDAAFKIIRLRVLKDLPKVHKIMRDLPKLCDSHRTTFGKREVMKISEDVDETLPKEECFDREKKPLTVEQIDAKWAAKNQRPIIYHLKKASETFEEQKEKETPLTLLEAAYKKLTHEEMDITHVALSDLPVARELAAKVGAKAKDIESEVYHHQKQIKKLASKK